MARPSKLTPETAKAICAEVEQGLTVGLASALSRVHRDTVYEWLARAKQDRKAGLEPGWGEGESPFVSFSDDLERARAVFAKVLRDGIRGAKHGTGERDWKALAYLERTRFPGHLSDRALEQEHGAASGEPGGPARPGPGLRLVDRHGRDLSPTAKGGDSDEGGGG